jgi:hypothetical protein
MRPSVIKERRHKRREILGITGLLAILVAVVAQELGHSIIFIIAIVLCGFAFALVNND